LRRKEFAGVEEVVIGLDTVVTTLT